VSFRARGVGPTVRAEALEAYRWGGEESQRLSYSTGRQAEGALRSAGVTLNRNVIPYDTNGSWYTSGLRLGTPAVTTLGMGAAEMREIAPSIANVLRATAPTKTPSGKPSLANYTLDESVRAQAEARARGLLGRFPLYPEIEL